MAPPESVLSSKDGCPELGAGFFRLELMRQRRDFIAAARGQRKKTPSFLLQIRRRSDDAPPRVGFTCSKKVGNAVQRNRAKRRLREVARLVLPPLALSGHDYVLIGKRHVTATYPFDRMLADLRAAVER